MSSRVDSKDAAVQRLLAARHRLASLGVTSIGLFGSFVRLLYPAVLSPLELASADGIILVMADLQKPEDYDRQCPGQNYCISDAVCSARQARNYPLCKDCQFQDQSAPDSKSAEDNHIVVQAGMIEKIFKAYDVRGIYPDALNEDVAWRIGHATAQFLRSQLTGYDRSDPKVNTLAVGRDMRKSSSLLVYREPRP